MSERLAAIVGRDHVATSEEDRRAYAIDVYWSSRLQLDRNLTMPMPDLVVRPDSTQQVAAIVALANELRLPVTPYGGGSGSQGGIVPVHGGITVDLKRMNSLLRIDEVSGICTAQAGINGADLEAQLNRRGWMFPHYPASANAATLGGYLACRGSGTLSTKYGKAEDLVLQVEVVLPDGSIARTLPVPSHAAGPGTLQCFLGSEGVFGIITEATIQIAPLPSMRRFRSFLFPDLHAGLEAARLIMRDRLDPCVMRLYDERATIKTVQHVLGLAVASGAYMVIGFDGFEELVQVQESRAFGHCTAMRAEDLGAEAGQRWWDHRYHFYWPPKAPDLPSMIGTLDTVTTFDRLERLYLDKRATLEREFAQWGLYYYAHFSHWFRWGGMVYDRFVIESPPAEASKALQLHDAVWDTATRINLAHGGVLNEHHGVGLKLARHMRQQYGEGFKLLEGIKDRIDPHHLLNPGKMGFGPPR
ncbi:MAG: FAD-binding oxidoreductase [Casimicrobiaceae bacterium]